MDGISLLLAFTVLVLGLMVMIFSTSYMPGEINEEKFYALLVAMIGSIIGLGCAGDLFNLWVWFEAMAVTSYMLVAFYRDEPASLEAGVKYLVQSATGSVFVLLGIALVFAQVGTLNLDEIVAAVSGTTPILLAAGAFFLIGFGVKTALVPLHTWLPDAHSQAPSGISAMLSGVVIEAGLVAMLRATGGLAGTSANWGGILLGFAAVNMLVGNLMALRQTQVKRLLAYSSVAHIGYMLLGLGVAVIFQTADGAVGAFFHLFNHAMMKGLAFLAAGALLYTLHLSKGEHSPLVLDDLDGASRRYPLVAFAFSVAVLGLGGLPPLAGFMSKWQIFMAGVSTQNIWIILLVIFAALNSVLSLVYYAPLVNRIYRHEPSAVSQIRHAHDLRHGAAAGLAVCRRDRAWHLAIPDGLAYRSGRRQPDDRFWASVERSYLEFTSHSSPGYSDLHLPGLDHYLGWQKDGRTGNPQQSEIQCLQQR